MKVNSMFIETLRFAFTRRIKGADGKKYMYLSPELPYNVKKHMMPQYHYCLFMFYMSLVPGLFSNRLSLEEMLLLAGFWLVIAIPCRFFTYHSAILGKSDLWETETVPYFGYHSFREAIRGTFLFHCKDVDGVSHHLSIKKYGLPLLPFFVISVVLGYYWVNFDRYAVLNGASGVTRFTCISMFIAPLYLYWLFLDSYLKIRERRSVWREVNAPQADDTEGGSEYKL